MDSLRCPTYPVPVASGAHKTSGKGHMHPGCTKRTLVQILSPCTESGEEPLSYDQAHAMGRRNNGHYSSSERHVAKSATDTRCTAKRNGMHDFAHIQGSLASTSRLLRQSRLNGIPCAIGQVTRIGLASHRLLMCSFIRDTLRASITGFLWDFQTGSQARICRCRSHCVVPCVCKDGSRHGPGVPTPVVRCVERIPQNNRGSVLRYTYVRPGCIKGYRMTSGR